MESLKAVVTLARIMQTNKLKNLPAKARNSYGQNNECEHVTPLIIVNLLTVTRGCSEVNNLRVK